MTSKGPFQPKAFYDSPWETEGKASVSDLGTAQPCEKESLLIILFRI